MALSGATVVRPIERVAGVPLAPQGIHQVGPPDPPLCRGLLPPGWCASLAQGDLGELDAVPCRPFGPGITRLQRGADRPPSAHQLATQHIRCFVRDLGISGPPAAAIDDHVTPVGCPLRAACRRIVRCRHRGASRDRVSRTQVSTSRSNPVRLRTRRSGNQPDRCPCRRDGGAYSRIADRTQEGQTAAATGALTDRPAVDRGAAQRCLPGRNQASNPRRTTTARAVTEMRPGRPSRCRPPVGAVT